MTDEKTTFTPADEFIIHDLETLKVLADPLRLSIIEYLITPRTVKDVAEKIDKPPTKLYYHFNLLEKHNLIQMVFTRIVSGIVEKHYVASANVYRIAPGLLAPGNANFEENLEVTFSGLYGNTLNDLRESIKAGVIDSSDNAPGYRRMKIFQGKVYLSPERAEEFHNRLNDLFQEFEVGKNPNNNDELITSDKHAYKLMMIWHPSSRGDKK